MNISESERFMRFVSIDPGGCWLFSGAFRGPKTGGYKGFRRSRENGSKWGFAHRAAYEMFVGEIPSGLQLDHLCRVRSCVNPEHLEPVTSKENYRRGFLARGSKTHCPRGHPYSGDNLYVCPKKGALNCRACRKRQYNEYLERTRCEIEDSDNV